MRFLITVHGQFQSVVWHFPSEGLPLALGFFFLFFMCNSYRVVSCQTFSLRMYTSWSGIFLYTSWSQIFLYTSWSGIFLCTSWSGIFLSPSQIVDQESSAVGHFPSECLISCCKIVFISACIAQMFIRFLHLCQFVKRKAKSQQMIVWHFNFKAQHLEKKGKKMYKSYFAILLQTLKKLEHKK